MNRPRKPGEDYNRYKANEKALKKIARLKKQGHFTPSKKKENVK